MTHIDKHTHTHTKHLIHIFINKAVLDVTIKTVLPILNIFHLLFIPLPLKIQVVRVLTQILQTTFILLKNNTAQPKNPMSWERYEKTIIRSSLLQNKKYFRNFMFHLEKGSEQTTFHLELINNLESNILSSKPYLLSISGVSQHRLFPT